MTEENLNNKKGGYTAEEYTPEIKRQKMVPKEVVFEVCENCHERMKPPNSACLQCGYSVLID